MAKSSSVEHVKRINTAMRLIQQHRSTAKIVTVLVTKYGISHRQAYRYIEAAARAKKPTPIPEEKVPFTVKLPPRLIKKIHRHATGSEQTLSDVVSQALTVFLKRRGRG